MIEGNLLLSIYFETNVLLMTLWLLHKASNGLANFVSWDFSSLSRLTNARFVFLLAFIIPFLFRVLPLAMESGLNGKAEKPVQVVQLVLNSIIPTVSNTMGSSTGISPYGSLFSFTTLLSGLLLIGFSFLLIRLFFKVLRLKKIIKQAYCWKHIGKIYIHVSRETSIPFSTRIFGKGQIVIPESLFTSSEYFPVVLAHEGQHLRNGDVGWEIFMELCGLLFYWNPAIYLWKNELAELQEYACDEVVLSKGKISQHCYGRCLLQVTKQFHASHYNPVASCNMAVKYFSKNKSKSSLERRVKMLIQDSKPYSYIKALLHRSSSLAVLAILGLFVVACTYSDPEDKQILVEVELLQVELKEEYMNEIDVIEKIKAVNIEDFESYNKMLESLEKIESVSIVGSPAVTTLNQQQARVMMVRPSDDSESIFKIEIDMLPEIIKEDGIKLDLDLSITTANQSESEDPFSTGPQNVNNIKVQILIASEEFVVISPNYKGMNYVLLIKPTILDNL